jgi:NTE family protein
MVLRFTYRSVLFFLALSAAIASAAQPIAGSERFAIPATSTAHPKIGLVLSGGGARGLAHIGVLKELEAARIPIDFVAGTSMGSIVGGLYASGMPPAELERRVLAMDWDSMFADRPPREELSLRRKADDQKFSLPFELGMRDGVLRAPISAVGSSGLERMLKALTHEVPPAIEFDRLPIPYRAVATDLVSGEAVVFDRGNLASVMRASMSVPAAFAPVEIDGRLLVDGGLVNNLPVDLVRAMGADIVIAVNIGTPLLPREELGSILGVGTQMLNILTEQNVRASLAMLRANDILVTPDLNLITAMDFNKGTDAINRGAEAARGVLPLLTAYALPEEVHVGRLQALRTPTLPNKIDAVRIEGSTLFAAQTIEAALAANVGTAVDEKRIERDLSWVFGRGDFERLDYRIVNERDQNVLLVSAREKSWGPNFFRFGFGFNTDFNGAGQFSLIGNHTRRWLNSLGAEWRNEVQVGRQLRLSTEFYQPLNAAETFFLSASAERRRRLGEVSVQIEDGLTTRPLAEYASRETRVLLDLGIAFGRYGELRFGPVYEQQVVTPRIGDLALPSFRANQSGVQASFTIDQRNSAVFAKSGYRIEASAQKALDALGASTSFTRYQWLAEHALSIGSNTVDFAVRGGSVSRSEVLGYPQFELGGFLQLSGLRSGQLRGDRMSFARVKVMRQVGTMPAFGRGIYVGGSFEAGKVDGGATALEFNRSVFGGSLFLGLDTSIGPLYLGAGRASGGNHSAYLFLGRP